MNHHSPHHAHHHSNGENSHHGALIVAVAAFAAAAGWYYLYGAHDAYKHRKHVKAWVFKLKADILEHIASLQEITKDSYHDAIDTISKRYHGHAHVDQGELALVVDRVKKHWDDIVAHLASETHHS